MAHKPLGRREEVVGRREALEAWTASAVVGCRVKGLGSGALGVWGFSVYSLGIQYLEE